MSKHTQGPWNISKNATPDYSPQYSIYSGNNQSDLAIVLGNNSEVDAKLIAAAPDLLAACKRMLPWIGRLIADGGHLDCVLPRDCEIAMRQAHAAIDKATN